MAFLIGGANSAAATGGFEVANSCRFNDGDTSKMLKEMGTATDNKKFTFNCWLKRSTLGTNQVFAHARNGTSGPYFNMMFGTDDKLRVYGPDKDGGNDFDYKTTQVLRDVGAWYCITVAFDSSHATAGNRIRMYINGVEVTSFATETNPAEDVIYVGNYTGYDFGIGANLDNSAYFDGYIAECVHIDGQQLTPTSFGEFDEDSPDIWKPIDVSGLTFGNNGFYLDFEASDNLGNDANGGTDLTETNLAAADQATDTPTNNFCTWNPLDNFYKGAVFSEGNCMTVQGATGKNNWITSTMALTKGKWYVEMVVPDVTTDHTNVSFGISDIVSIDATSALGDEPGSAQCGFRMSNGEKRLNDASTSYGNSYSVGQVIGMALNLDDSEIHYYINNTVQNSGTAISITAVSGTRNGYYLIACGDESEVAGTIQINFGGCSGFALSSAESDADGYGNFEYAPPSGFFAICTKNLAEYG